MIAREGRRVERVGKDEKGLKSLKIEDTMQEGGETNTSYQGNPDGASRVLVKGGVRSVCDKTSEQREEAQRRGRGEM